jgi:type II secretory pathway component PulM
MTERISKPVRQLAAIALLMAACVGLWSFVWTPVFGTLQQQDASIAEKREVLGRLLSAEDLAGEASALEQKSKSLNTGKLTLRGDSDPLRIAELQTALTKIATDHGLRLRSTRALPGREAKGVRLVGIQAQFQATLEQLQKVLLALEDSEPILVIEALRVAGTTSTADAKSETPLDINIDVFGATGTGKG